LIFGQSNDLSIWTIQSNMAKPLAFVTSSLLMWVKGWFRERWIGVGCTRWWVRGFGWRG